ncbi:MAG: Ribonuclease, partial [Labilithrix sp.]|nr:Ribonuclease [Labilithrix sp.]
IRPGSAARPTALIADLAKKKGAELAPGIHRVDERLAMRIQLLADHFGKAGSPVKLNVVSGYRPTSIGSMHATGRAIDFRVEGAKNEDVVAFCKTLADTGCGFYPNSSFVHLDVRDPGAGHVSWIDASGPGETPRYVSTWPPQVSKIADKLEPAGAKQPIEKLDKEETTEPVDEHPSELPQ